MFRLASAVLLNLAAAQAIHAQTIDVAKIACEGFLLSHDARSSAVWLNGYYHDQRNDPGVAPERAKENARKLNSACVAAKNSKLPVVQVIEVAKAT